MLNEKDPTFTVKEMNLKLNSLIQDYEKISKRQKQIDGDSIVYSNHLWLVKFVSIQSFQFGSLLITYEWNEICWFLKILQPLKRNFKELEEIILQGIS
ncbi:hypothetical protein BpHYR1_009126 [Brachionus plicatilis]|uniref:Uncharacterized protein n=1 Tax=Brachionus plicatilis TaxID=10195 RepID=A0A3M7SFI3_BRAPC|nr:hypothetical protein BpHYR1_009126 [Brachionus plicatilis]